MSIAQTDAGVLLREDMPALAAEAAKAAVSSSLKVSGSSKSPKGGMMRMSIPESPSAAYEQFDYDHLGKGTEQPRWKQYEIKHGSQQTPMKTTFEGQNVGVRLDNPPTGSSIVDFKDYIWSKPAYQKPFIQRQVIEDFQTQILKYKTIRPNIHFQVSEEPPPWVLNALKEVGGTYNVVP